MRVLLITALLVTVMGTVWGRSLQSEQSSWNFVPLGQIILQRTKRTPGEYGHRGYDLTTYSDLNGLLDGYQRGFAAANRMLNKVSHSGLHTGTNGT